MFVREPAFCDHVEPLERRAEQTEVDVAPHRKADDHLHIEDDPSVILHAFGEFPVVSGIADLVHPGLDEEVFPKRRVRSKRRIEDPRSSANTDHDIVQEHLELVLESGFQRIDRPVDDRCIRILLEVFYDRLEPGSWEETICIGRHDQVIFACENTVVSGPADLFARLDEDLVRVFFRDLAGLVLGISVDHDDLVLISGKRLVTETFQEGFDTFLFIE